MKVEYAMQSLLSRYGINEGAMWLKLYLKSI